MTKSSHREGESEAAQHAHLSQLDKPNLITTFLLLTLAWASARFYYFAFYVLEKYVDPSLRYTGVVGLVKAMHRQRLGPRPGETQRSKGFAQ